MTQFNPLTSVYLYSNPALYSKIKPEQQVTDKGSAPETSLTPVEKYKQDVTTRKGYAADQIEILSRSLNALKAPTKPSNDKDADEYKDENGNFDESLYQKAWDKYNNDKADYDEKVKQITNQLATLSQEIKLCEKILGQIAKIERVSVPQEIKDNVKNALEKRVTIPDCGDYTSQNIEANGYITKFTSLRKELTSPVESINEQIDKNLIPIAEPVFNETYINEDGEIDTAKYLADVEAYIDAQNQILNYLEQLESIKKQAEEYDILLKKLASAAVAKDFGEKLEYPVVLIGATPKANTENLKPNSSNDDIKTKNSEISKAISDKNSHKTNINNNNQEVASMIDAFNEAKAPTLAEFEVDGVPDVDKFNAAVRKYNLEQEGLLDDINTLLQKIEDEIKECEKLNDKIETLNGELEALMQQQIDREALEALEGQEFESLEDIQAKINGLDVEVTEKSSDDQFTYYNVGNDTLGFVEVKVAKEVDDSLKQFKDKVFESYDDLVNEATSLGLSVIYQSQEEDGKKYKVGNNALGWVTATVKNYMGSNTRGIGGYSDEEIDEVEAAISQAASDMENGNIEALGTLLTDYKKYGIKVTVTKNSENGNYEITMAFDTYITAIAQVVANDDVKNYLTNTLKLKIEGEEETPKDVEQGGDKPDDTTITDTLNKINFVIGELQTGVPESVYELRTLKEDYEGVEISVIYDHSTRTNNIVITYAAGNFVSETFSFDAEATNSILKGIGIEPTPSKNITPEQKKAILGQIKQKALEDGVPQDKAQKLYDELLKHEDLQGNNFTLKEFEEKAKALAETIATSLGIKPEGGERLSDEAIKLAIDGMQRGIPGDNCIGVLDDLKYYVQEYGVQVSYRQEGNEYVISIDYMDKHVEPRHTVTEELTNYLEKAEWITKASVNPDEKVDYKDTTEAQAAVENILNKEKDNLIEYYKTTCGKESLSEESWNYLVKRVKEEFKDSVKFSANDVIGCAQAIITKDNGKELDIAAFQALVKSITVDNYEKVIKEIEDKYGEGLKVSLVVTYDKKQDKVKYALGFNNFKGLVYTNDLSFNDEKQEKTFKEFVCEKGYSGFTEEILNNYIDFRCIMKDGITNENYQKVITDLLTRFENDQNFKISVSKQTDEKGQEVYIVGSKYFKDNIITYNLTPDAVMTEFFTKKGLIEDDSNPYKNDTATVAIKNCANDLSNNPEDYQTIINNIRERFKGDQNFSISVKTYKNDNGQDVYRVLLSYNDEQEGEKNIPVSLIAEDDTKSDEMVQYFTGIGLTIEDADPEAAFAEMVESITVDNYKKIIEKLENKYGDGLNISLKIDLDKATDQAIYKLEFTSGDLTASKSLTFNDKTKETAFKELVVNKGYGGFDENTLNKTIKFESITKDGITSENYQTVITQLLDGTFTDDENFDFSFEKTTNNEGKVVYKIACSYKNAGTVTADLIADADMTEFFTNKGFIKTEGNTDDGDDDGDDDSDGVEGGDNVNGASSVNTNNPNDYSDKWGYVKIKIGDFLDALEKGIVLPNFKVLGTYIAQQHPKDDGTFKSIGYKINYNMDSYDGNGDGLSDALINKIKSFGNDSYIYINLPYYSVQGALYDAIANDKNNAGIYPEETFEKGTYWGTDWDPQVNRERILLNAGVKDTAFIDGGGYPKDGAIPANSSKSGNGGGSQGSGDTGSGSGTQGTGGSQGSGDTGSGSGTQGTGGSQGSGNVNGASSVNTNNPNDYSDKWGYVKIKIGDFLDALEKGIVLPNFKVLGTYIAQQHPKDDGTFKSIGYKINYNMDSYDGNGDGLSDALINKIKSFGNDSYIYINLPYYSVQGALYDAIANDKNNAGIYPEEAFKKGTYWSNVWDPECNREKLLLNPGEKDTAFIEGGGYPKDGAIPANSSTSGNGGTGGSGGSGGSQGSGDTGSGSGTQGTGGSQGSGNTGSGSGTQGSGSTGTGSQSTSTATNTTTTNPYTNSWAHVKIKASDLLAAGFKNPVKLPDGREIYVGIYNADGVKIDDNNNNSAADEALLKSLGDAYVYINIPYSSIQGKLLTAIQNDPEGAAVYNDDNVSYKTVNGVKQIETDKLGKPDTAFVNNGGYSWEYNIYAYSWAHVKIKASDLRAAGFKNPVTAPNGKKYYVGIYNSDGLKIDDKKNNSEADDALLASMGDEYVYVNIPYSYIQGKILAALQNDKKAAVYNDDNITYGYKEENNGVRHIETFGKPDTEFVANGGYTSGITTTNPFADASPTPTTTTSPTPTTTTSPTSTETTLTTNPARQVAASRGNNYYADKWGYMRVKASDVIKYNLIQGRLLSFFDGNTGVRIDSDSTNWKDDEAQIKKLGDSYIYINLPYSVLTGAFFEAFKKDYPNTFVIKDPGNFNFDKHKIFEYIYRNNKCVGKKLAHYDAYIDHDIMKYGYDGV